MICDKCGAPMRFDFGRYDKFLENKFRFKLDYRCKHWYCEHCDTSYLEKVSDRKIEKAYFLHSIKIVNRGEENDS